MKVRFFLTLLGCLIFLSACSGNGDKEKKYSTSQGSQDTEEIEVLETEGSDGEEVTEDGAKVYESLFNLDNFISVDIDISQEEIAKIQKDFETYEKKGAKSPIYRRADKVTIKINDKSYEMEDVGVRMKGNTSRTSFYSEKDGIYNIIHLKLSFDETFEDKEYYGDDAVKWDNKEDKKKREERTFAGMNGIDLKYNGGYDTTYLNEYYCMEMFRDNGVLAAKLTPSALKVAGKSWGVVKLYEPVDKKFLKRRLDKKDLGGDLYKAGWANNMPAGYYKNSLVGIADPDAGTDFSFDLKTNKDTSKHESFLNLVEVLNKNELTKKDFDEVMVSDNFVKFAAVGYFVGDPDDLRNNYNNHFVYFRKSDGKALIIPYDYDIAFGVSSNWNPSGMAMTNVNPFDEVPPFAFIKEQINPMFKYGISSEDFYLKEYKSALAEVAKSKWMKSETYETLFNKVKKNYADYLKPDIDFKNAEESNWILEYDFTTSKVGNMSPSTYMETILSTYETAIQ